jgi:Carboxypeptidase regulatory-like domain
MKPYTVSNLRALVFATLLTTSVAVAAKPQGQIVGAVLDESGVPVPDAEVTLQPRGIALNRTMVDRVRTDALGQFKMEAIDWGHYTVCAGKAADGYPDTRVPLYRVRPAPDVVLSPESPSARVTVTLGPRGGILDASVRDSATHAPLSSQLLLQRADGSAMVYLSERPDFQVLLPADTDVLIEVRVEGYEPWVYASNGRSIIRLKSGEHMKIDVEVTPVPKVQDGGSGDQAYKKPT